MCMDNASPASLPCSEEDVATLRQNVAQLRMENASAAAHIETLEARRSRLFQSDLYRHEEAAGNVVG